MGKGSDGLRGLRSGNRPCNPLASAGGGREVIPPRRLVGVARSSAVRHGGFRGLERQNICVSVYEMQLEEERAASVFTQWVAVRAR